MKNTSRSIRLLTNILERLYIIKPLRRYIRKLCAQLEGGEVYSVTLRRIAASYHKIKIGKYSYGSCFSFHRIPSGTEIGRYCSFADGVVIFNGNHPLERISLHPFFYNPIFKYVDKDMISRSKLIVGNDVWIGFNAIILSSVRIIADGAVIGAGSVVTKDIPPFAVVAGNPAKIIKYRFTEARIREIMASPWWEKDMDELKDKLDDFLHPLDERVHEGEEGKINSELPGDN